MLHIRVALHKLCESVPIHLGHFNIRNYQGRLLIKGPVLLGLGQEVPQIMPVGEHAQVYVAGLIQALLYHMRQEYRVLSY